MAEVKLDGVTTPALVRPGSVEPTTGAFVSALPSLSDAVSEDVPGSINMAHLPNAGRKRASEVPSSTLQMPSTSVPDSSSSFSSSPNDLLPQIHNTTEPHQDVTSSPTTCVNYSPQDVRSSKNYAMDTVSVQHRQDGAARQPEGSAVHLLEGSPEPRVQAEMQMPRLPPSSNTSRSTTDETTSNASNTRIQQPHGHAPRRSPNRVRPNISEILPAPKRAINMPPRYINNAGHIPYRLNYRGSDTRAQWRTWVEVGVRIRALPPYVTLEDLWENFKVQGTIIRIEIFEDNRGVRDGNASIRFSPPPTNPFWEAGQTDLRFADRIPMTVGLQLEEPKRTFLHPSPVNPQKKYQELMTLQADSIEFGIMLDETTMMVMKEVKPTTDAGIFFRQSMLHREINTEFQLQIRNPRKLKKDVTRSSGRHDRDEIFRFRIPFSRLQQIKRISGPAGKLVLLISIEDPPKFFKKLDVPETHDERARIWFENDAWYRQTDIAYAPHRLKGSALTLKKETPPVLDIGRWTTYRLTFTMSKDSWKTYEQMTRALKDYNVETTPSPNLRIVPQQMSSIWNRIDPPQPKQGKDAAADFHDLLHKAPPKLCFDVRYQLEVCISQGILNEYNLKPEFINKLMAVGETEARNLLEYIANQRKRVFDPMSIFDLQVAASSAWVKIPRYCIMVRSVTVTPSTMYFNTPSVETSNRVIRHFSEHANRFIRVRFTDERQDGKIFATTKENLNEIFTRVKRTMANGIKIGDVHYRFLAFGNAQFREHGAYFFAPVPHLSTEDIRNWMGVFREIRVVAKYASRLGQCFSTTRAIPNAAPTIVEIPDIVRNGFTFTDGVGKISPFLAQITAQELGMPQGMQETPSVFQFRLGGCKGVLAIAPELKAREVHIRKSQYKFPANHRGLEIIRCSQYACANLNRQLVLVLSALGVPDHVFVQKLKDQLSDLEQAMTNPEKALSILQKDIDANQMTLTLAGMILDGFQKAQEPFITSLLHLWRAWSIKYLKEKARITINGGALLLGCVDETATLRGHFNDDPKAKDAAPIDEKAELIPEIFVQLSGGPGKRPQIILGPMLLARNPSLHPGDIRVVCGVDVAALHHLKDVVVLPQTGDRDVASMCSGGDLDGDDFIVMWDQDLLPQEWNHEPMDYTAPPPMEHHGEIYTDDLTSFFVTYMKNDTLATIAHAHVAQADWLEQGVKEDKCLRLAALHSMAVDFVKTGQPAQMARDLAPRKWPHFMDKNKPKEQTYVSRKVLGKLYDQVERVAFMPAFGNLFDRRILQAFNIHPDMLETARKVKQEYDTSMHRIMAQFAIMTEFEVWSTFVMSHNSGNDFKFHEQIGNVSTALKVQVRKICVDKAGGKEYELLAPFVAAMYKVTADEMTVAVNECNQSKVVGGQKRPVRQMKTATMPMMSFPWLFQDILGKIAKLDAFERGEADLLDLRDGTELARENVLSVPLKKPRMPIGGDSEGGDVHTAAGVTHWGELLRLEFNQAIQPTGTISVNDETNEYHDNKGEDRSARGWPDSLAADLASIGFETRTQDHTASMMSDSPQSEAGTPVSISGDNSPSHELSDSREEVLRDDELSLNGRQKVGKSYMTELEAISNSFHTVNITSNSTGPESPLAEDRQMLKQREELMLQDEETPNEEKGPSEGDEKETGKPLNIGGPGISSQTSAEGSDDESGEEICFVAKETVMDKLAAFDDSME